MRHSMRCLPQSNLIAIDDEGPESSRRVSKSSHFGTQTSSDFNLRQSKVFLTGRDATKKDLNRNIDHMPDAIYSPAGTDPKILASVSAAFDHVSKVGTEIGCRQTTS